MIIFLVMVVFLYSLFLYTYAKNKLLHLLGCCGSVFTKTYWRCKRPVYHAFKYYIYFTNLSVNRRDKNNFLAFSGSTLSA